MEVELVAVPIFRSRPTFARCHVRDPVLSGL